MTQPADPVRLAVRRGLDSDDRLFEGIPEHLRGILAQWADDHLGLRTPPAPLEQEARSHILAAIAVRCRVPVRRRDDALQVLAGLVDTDQDAFLDVVDMHLQIRGGGVDLLYGYLALGESAWTVSTTPPHRLERRVPDEQRAQYASAAGVGDQASADLQEAWGKIHGRRPNPSDAWDHAIKAVETLLQPVVEPMNDKATLGSMLAALESRPARWSFVLTTSSKKVGPVESLTAMLRLMWPNPDRHGSGTSRKPEDGEAKQVVGLAVLIVSWLRAGALTLVVAPTDPHASQ